MPRTHVDGGLLTAPAGPVVLGIDPSLTGFAMTAIEAEGDRFETWLYRSPQRGVHRLADIWDWLDERWGQLSAARFPIHNVAVEDTVVASHAAVALGELSGTIRLAMLFSEIVAENAQYPLKVPPPMLKKYATDKGNAKKNEVMLGVYKRWGQEFADDNMADSYVLARIAQGRAETAFQTDILTKLADPKFRDPVKV